MATLTVTKDYSDTQVLFEADLDAMKSSIETFVNTTKLNDDNFQDAGITASDKFLDGSVKAAILGDGVIESSLINASAVTTAKIAAGGIEEDNIADEAVDSTVIAAAGIPRRALAALNGAQSAAPISQSSGSTSLPASPLSDSLISITSKNGNPILLWLTGTVSANDPTSPSNDIKALEGGVALYVNGTQTYVERLQNSVWSGSSTEIEVTWPGEAIVFAYPTTAGVTYTFGINIVSGSGLRMTLTNVTLNGFEILNGNT